MAGTALPIAEGGTSQKTAPGARIALGLEIGTDIQAWDADLDAIAALATTGIAVRTAANTWATRTLTGTANEITVSNGDGVAGNPTISIPAAVTFTGKTITGGTYAGITLSGTTTLPNSWTVTTTSDQVRFSTATANSALRVSSSDPGTSGASFYTFHDSASPAVNDNIGFVNFQGRDSANNITNYGSIRCQIVDPTDGTEDGRLTFFPTVNGTGTAVFQADSAGLTITSGNLVMPSGGIINWNSSDVTITHAANSLAFAGATVGYSFDDDLLLPSAGVINFNAGNYTLTHSADVLTANKDLRVTTVGTNAASVVTVDGTQTLGNKTLTTPTLILKQSSGPTPTAEGDIQWDTDDNALVVGDSSAQKIFRPNNWELVGVTDCTSVAAITFTNLSAYRNLWLQGYVRPATDGAALQLRTSTNNGSSYDAGASDYIHSFLFQNVAAAAATDGALDTRMLLHVTGVGNNAPEALVFNCHVFEFNQSLQCFFDGTFHQLNTATGSFTGKYGGRRASTTARDAIQFNWSSGNFAAIGQISVWGNRGTA